MIDKRTKHLFAGAKRGFALLDEKNPSEALASPERAIDDPFAIPGAARA
ncbi:MAG: hypothetical protein WCK73_17140 [Deltaproteobacteria bacterium]